MTSARARRRSSSDTRGKTKSQQNQVDINRRRTQSDASAVGGNDTLSRNPSFSFLSQRSRSQSLESRQTQVNISLSQLQKTTEKSLKRILAAKNTTSKKKKENIVKIFEDAGVADRLISPYLIRHTNNTQLVPVREVNQSQPSIDEISEQLENLKDRLEEIVENAKLTLGDLLSSNQENAAEQRDIDREENLLRDYQDLKLIIAEIRLAVYQGVKALASLTVVQQQQNQQFLQELEDLNNLLNSRLNKEIDPATIENYFDIPYSKQPEFYNKSLTGEQKWLLSTLTAFDKDGLFTQNNLNDLLKELGKLDSPVTEAYQTVTARPDKLISRTIDSNTQKELFLNALADMVVEGGEIGLELSLLTLNEELEILSRPMLDSEFISPLEDDSFINPTVLWDPYSNFFNYIVEDKNNVKLNVYPAWLTLLHELGHYNQSLTDPEGYQKLLATNQVALIEDVNLKIHEKLGAEAAKITPRENYQDHIFETERMTTMLEYPESKDLNLDALENLRNENNGMPAEIRANLWKQLYQQTVRESRERLFNSLFPNQNNQNENLFEEATPQEKDSLQEYFASIDDLQRSNNTPTRSDVIDLVKQTEDARKIAEKYGYNQEPFVKMMSLMLTVFNFSN